MKKIISFVLAAAMSLSTLPVLADWNNDEDIMSLLSELNIMVGDDDGNLRLDDNVSSRIGENVLFESIFPVTYNCILASRGGGKVERYSAI